MTSPNTPHSKKPKGFAAFLALHRRALILLGATITLSMYFLKDVVRERTKEKAAAINAGSSAYLASMPELRAQLSDLFSGEQMLKGSNPGSVVRNKVLLLIGNLTLRAQTNTLQVSAFLKAMPDAISIHGPNVDDIMRQTTEVADAGNQFLAHPSADPATFQASGKSLIQQFTNLENSVGKTGSELKIFADERSEKLERASSFYGTIVTILYLLGLALTVVTGLYGIEMLRAE